MARLQRDFARIENNFTIIPNEILSNKEMKSSTKNILLTMFSLPPSWDFSISGISKCVYEGKETVQKALVELEKIGYITRRRERKENGTLGAMIYTIHQFPVSEDKNTYKKNFLPDQDVKNQKQENPKQDSETQLRTNGKLRTNDYDLDNDNNNNISNDVNISRTNHNSFSNEKDNSKPNGLDLHNSQVQEPGADAPETKESNSSKTNITMTLGRKERSRKENTLKDMPTRAKEIVEQIPGCEDLADKTYDCIDYFMRCHKAETGHEHVNLTNSKLKEAVEIMLSTLTVPVNGAKGDFFENDYNPLIADNVSQDECEEVIDQYFDTVFREKTDYSIIHFTQTNVLTKIMNKCYLNGGHWHESHEPY